MFSASPTIHPLTIEEIEEAATLFKDDLTRECKRLVRRGDSQGALSAIHAEEYIDKFVYSLKIHAGSQIWARAHVEPPAREPSMPARARPIHLPPELRSPGVKPPVRIKLSKMQREQQRQAREVAAASRCLGHPKHF